MITAKITLQTKRQWGSDQFQLTFMPDYAEGRNAEWALATPALSLSMSVKGAVADQFEVGKHYTLTFTEEQASE